MINPYQEIVSYSKNDFEDYLNKISVIKIFQPIFDEYEDSELCKQIVRYILYGYSLESDQLATVGNNWGEVSRRIFNKVGIDEEHFENVCLLKSDSIRLSIEKWLQFQNYDNWQMLSYSLSELKKSSGEIDIDAKYQSVVYSKDLLSLMNQALDAFIQNHSKLKAGVEALNKASKDKVTRSVADYALK
jgi:hypothetical protein